MNGNPISESLKKHYEETFARFGATSRGVDWGSYEADHKLRLERMLDVTTLSVPLSRPVTLLDVGCGYGSLIDLIKERKQNIHYHGIDISSAMVETGRIRHPEVLWTVGDVLDTTLELDRHDFVVCNGILTQKRDNSILDMNRFAKKLIRRMFDLCKVGVAFNIMTTHVNFMSSNLYYRNPVELLAWCMSELTPKIRLDHAYPIFEYTLYLYQPNCSEMSYGYHRTIFPIK